MPISFRLHQAVFAYAAKSDAQTGDTIPLSANLSRARLLPALLIVDLLLGLHLVSKSAASTSTGFSSHRPRESPPKKSQDKTREELKVSPGPHSKPSRSKMPRSLPLVSIVVLFWFNHLYTFLGSYKVTPKRNYNRGYRVNSNPSTPHPKNPKP